MSGRELERDRKQWLSFVAEYEKRAVALGIGALMVVPYGEALIHPWYWEGLARVSALAETDAVGAQTNLSFSPEQCLEDFRKAGGSLRKLRLWATFHPQMTEISAFVARCKQIVAKGAQLCAGCVGVPENLELLRRLRRELPQEIYLWVNKMDGLKRPYTQEEREAFLELDPYFERELLPFSANVHECAERLFVEGDERLHTCNISPKLSVDWRQLSGGNFPPPECNRKYCSCYLAYGGRNNFMNRVMFGEYPLFRIPRRPRAVFLDVSGTLLPIPGQIPQNRNANGRECRGEVPGWKESQTTGDLHKGKRAGADESKNGRPRSEIPVEVRTGLEALAREGASLFFATTLPYREVMRLCRGVRHLFAGGIFAGGAHLFLERDGERKEYFYELEDTLLSGLETLKRKFGFRILVCRNESRIYKITLLRPSRRPWEEWEAEAVIRAGAPGEKGIRYYVEGSCLQLVSSRAGKAEGVQVICKWLGITSKDAVAAGDSEMDAEMVELCGSPLRN